MSPFARAVAQPIVLPDGADPFADLSRRAERWPAAWVARDDGRDVPHVTLFRLRLRLDAPWRGRLHLSGDEWFEFFVNGEFLLRGPAISSPQRWLYQSVALELDAGEHEFLARVFAVGPLLRPEPAMSVAPGFLCCPDPDDALLPRLGTGLAAWEWTGVSAGWTFHQNAIVSQVGTAFGPVHQRLPWTGDWPPHPEDAPGNWRATFATRPAIVGAFKPEGGRLFPTLAAPATNHRISHLRLRHASADDVLAIYPGDSTAAELAPWQPLFAGGGVTVPPGGRVRLLVDFDDYVLGFAQLRVRGNAGARVDMTWTERLLVNTVDRECWSGRNSRSEIAGLYAMGPRDEWHLDAGGEWRLSVPWKRCGRYLEIIATAAADAPLVLADFRFLDGLPPTGLAPAYACDDALLSGIQSACRRVLEVGAESAFCDCPFYEQVQWVGDLYPILLCHLAAGRDEPMHRQALQLVADSAAGDLLTQARFPVNARKGVCVIPSFALWYVVAVHDFARWRGHRNFVRQLAPTLRRNLDTFLARRNERGLCTTPPGWNYFDWAPGFDNGSPPMNDRNECGPLNLLLAHACRAMADLDGWLDEPELAARWARRADELTAACRALLWREDRGLFADSPGIDAFSEHGQTLALLDGSLPAEWRDRITATLARADSLDFSDQSHGLAPLKPFFSHHLFEALTRAGRTDILFDRLRAWQVLIDLDFRTTPETLPGTRSDCHGWSAHPLFHVLASLGGVRPDGFAFERVSIRPQLGRINDLAYSVWTPRGTIAIAYSREGERRTLRATLPEGLPGTLHLPDGSQRALRGKVEESWLEAMG